MDNRGKNNPNYKNGIYISRFGYRYILMSGHPRTDKRGYVNEAILIAEKAMSKYLPPKAVIHHINGNTLDNCPENLVVCENQAYHLLLHMRDKALKATGDPHKRKCKHCKNWDDVENLKKWRSTFYHQKCANEYIYSLKRRSK